MSFPYFCPGRTMKSILLPLSVLALASCFSSVRAATISATVTPNLGIPDASSGQVLPSTVVLNTGGQLIASLRVSVTVRGGSNGDLYVLLEHAGKTSVLVNRPGRNTSSLATSFGSSSRGLNVTFFDAAPTDLQSTIPMTLDPDYAAGGSKDGQAQVTGDFKPDGRDVSPFNADLNTPTPSTLMLSEFANLAADGPWTLTLVRINSVEASTLESWSIEATTTAVPEPGAALPSMLIVCGGVYLRYIRRRRPTPTVGQEVEGC